MKFLCLLLLIATFPHAAPAIQNQPQIEVLKFSWRKLPQSRFPSAKQSQEKRNETIDASIRAEYEQEKPDYARIRSLEAMKNHGAPLDVPKAADKAYEYKFKMRNTGSKQIISLKWAYVFKDAATGNELVRHSFESKVNVRPDQQKEVILYTDSGPPMVVNAGAIKKSGQAWDESVIIEAVEYLDGSRWAKE